MSKIKQKVDIKFVSSHVQNFLGTRHVRHNKIDRRHPTTLYCTVLRYIQI